MKLVLKILLFLLLLLVLALVLKQQYSDTPLVQEIDQRFHDAAPNTSESIDRLLNDAKTGLATAEIRSSDEKYKAWENWYKVPEACRKTVLGDELVECTNHRIRARREFDALWQAGKL